jgi:hypothetical protein
MILFIPVWSKTNNWLCIIHFSFRWRTACNQAWVLTTVFFHRLINTIFRQYHIFFKYLCILYLCILTSILCVLQAHFPQDKMIQSNIVNVTKLKLPPEKFQFGGSVVELPPHDQEVASSSPTWTDLKRWNM